MTEQNKDGAKCGGRKWSVYCEETHVRQVLTRDILLRDVKLFGFMKKRFNFAMSKPTVSVHILHINLNEDVFFSSATLFLLC